MATFTAETETDTTPLFTVVPAPPEAMNPRAAAATDAAAASVVPAPDDPRAKMEEVLRGMIELREKLASLGLVPSPSPPKWWWFPSLSLTGWFPRLVRLWRLLVDILHGRREFPDYFVNRQLVQNCLDHYNHRHPGNEYEPLLCNVTQNPHCHNAVWFVHGNFVARKKGSGFFSFLTAPRSVFFFELAYMDGFRGVVTCSTVEEPAYSVLGYPLWWATRTSGKLDSFCKTCHRRFGIPRPGVEKIPSCGHNNVAEVCEMCYCRSHTLHPDPGEFAFGYHHPYHPYPKRC